MKDEYMKEILIKILVSAIIFAFLIVGLCIYMLKPEKEDELSEDIEIEDVVENEVDDVTEDEVEYETENNVGNEINTILDYDFSLNNVE